ncbi:helix-turn-helix domain-containing protein [Candidatus Enterococcus ferrettii]|uniref:OmpR/PhoB-type domain-containing protein n=1 Tax=Candidatus Enterococcus ferrettii TaxID=2815324 RepID=A0ABV0ENQ2_9ENTE|nr:helix-turn-helix domain-containing protein [Enterococcus sp. 665A]MBO1341925.1 helix-turn-helix domain-containing protein [Enterococcus sp. 665A]
MSQIILLSSCPYAEQSFEKNLKLLGHEVFCTSQLNHELNFHGTGKQLFHFFEYVFISETISDEQTKSIIEELDSLPLTIIRKVSQQPTKQKVSEWEMQGISNWLLNISNIEEIRDKMVLASKEMVHKRRTTSKPCLSHLEKENLFFQLHWTKTEKRIMDAFLKNEGMFITRNRLCELVWNSECTQSRLSQLSYTINKLKKKLKDVGINEEMITTSWGKGYQLNPTLSELLQQQK